MCQAAKQSAHLFNYKIRNDKACVHYSSASLSANLPLPTSPLLVSCSLCCLLTFPQQAMILHVWAMISDGIYNFTGKVGHGNIAHCLLQMAASCVVLNLPFVWISHRRQLNAASLLPRFWFHLCLIIFSRLDCVSSLWNTSSFSSRTIYMLCKVFSSCWITFLTAWRSVPLPRHHTFRRFTSSSHCPTSSRIRASIRLLEIVPFGLKGWSGNSRHEWKTFHCHWGIVIGILIKLSEFLIKRSTAHSPVSGHYDNESSLSQLWTCLTAEGHRAICFFVSGCKAQGSLSARLWRNN